MGFDFSDLPSRDGMYLRDALQGEFTDVDEGKRQVQVTFPHDTVDTYKTTFGRDAFRSSFEARKPLMCWQHDLKDPIGHAISAQVTPRSNELVGQFSDFDAVQNSKRAFSQIQDGTITDFSFGFRQPKYENHPVHRGVRNIREALMMEFSPVSIGSIPGAIATGLREEDFMSEHSVAEITELVKAGLIEAEEGKRMLAAMPEFRDHITVVSPDAARVRELEAELAKRNAGGGDEPTPEQVRIAQLEAELRAARGEEELTPEQKRVAELEAELRTLNEGKDSGQRSNVDIPDPITADAILGALPENWQRAIREANAVFAIAPEGTEFFRSDDFDAESAGSIAGAIGAAHTLATDWIKDTDVRSLPEEVQQAIQLWNAAGTSTDALLDVLNVEGRAPSTKTDEVNVPGSENMSPHQVKCLLCAGTGQDEDGKTCPQCGGSGVVALTRALTSMPSGSQECPRCHGTGKAGPKAGSPDPGECPGCKGKGWVTHEQLQHVNGTRAVPDDAPTGSKTCPTCDGTGKILKGHMRCHDCHGKGWVSPSDQEDMGHRSSPDSWSEKPWGDFKQADYSPEEWKRACLIVNGDGATKDQCKLPVREPSGTINVHGVEAAATRLDSTEASSEDKAEAASKLASYYGQLKREVPPTVEKHLNRDDHEDVENAEDGEKIRQAALERLNRRAKAEPVTATA
jgi:HK97 family phage prohead protease